MCSVYKFKTYKSSKPRAWADMDGGGGIIF